MQWEYFNRFEAITDVYLPVRGEGDTLATQAVTAVNKLVYKWYNDGDVYDNRYILDGWCNDLSSYANWLYKHTPAKDILMRITSCMTDEEYEELLVDLADMILDDSLLRNWNELPKTGSIYECDGPFEFEESEDEEEDDWDDKVY